MGSKLTKVNKKVRARIAGYEAIPPRPGSKYHKPGSQNLRKN